MADGIGWKKQLDARPEEKRLLYRNTEDMTGQCIVCGRKMVIVISRGNNRFQSIFLCPECDKKLRLIEAKEAAMSLTAELEESEE